MPLPDSRQCSHDAVFHAGHVANSGVSVLLAPTKLLAGSAPAELPRLGIKKDKQYYCGTGKTAAVIAPHLGGVTQKLMVEIGSPEPAVSRFGLSFCVTYPRS
jgi:hypothetical protein